MASKFVFQISIKGFDELTDDFSPRPGTTLLGGCSVVSRLADHIRSSTQQLDAYLSLSTRTRMARSIGYEFVHDHSLSFTVAVGSLLAIGGRSQYSARVGLPTLWYCDSDT
jgi:hypothetical protein